MQKEYQQTIDIYKLASELIVDDVVQPNELRNVLIQRFNYYESKELTFSTRKTSCISSIKMSCFL